MRRASCTPREQWATPKWKVKSQCLPSVCTCRIYLILAHNSGAVWKVTPCVWYKAYSDVISQAGMVWPQTSPGQQLSLLLLLLLAAGHAFQSCPSICTCKWKNGQLWLYRLYYLYIHEKRRFRVDLCGEISVFWTEFSNKIFSYLRSRSIKLNAVPMKDWIYKKYILNTKSVHILYIGFHLRTVDIILVNPVGSGSAFFSF